MQAAHLRNMRFITYYALDTCSQPQPAQEKRPAVGWNAGELLPMESLPGRFWADAATWPDSSWPPAAGEGSQDQSKRRSFISV
jgi:hypothetical protein